jgi:hypothetical protein
VFEPVDDAIERIARHLRRPIQIDPALDARVMREIAALPAPGPVGPLAEAWRWLRRPRQLTLSPLGGLGAAVVLALVVLFARLASAPRASPQSESRVFQFVLVAPRATHVSLVGDFNDWDATRTPMGRAGSEALWTAVVSLAPGRYHYAFFVDGARWLADPSAPVARDQDYAEPSSVLTVGGGS